MTDDICQGSLPDVCNQEGYECNIECCSTDLCNNAVEGGGEGEGRKNFLELSKMQCNASLCYVAHVTFAYPKYTKNISFLLNILP